MTSNSFPSTRMRRMRRDEFSRRLMRETQLSVDALIYPVFVVEGRRQRQPVASMPGIERLSRRRTAARMRALVRARGFRRSPCFRSRRPRRSRWMPANPGIRTGIAQQAVRAVKKEFPALGVITDVALDPFTTHGQDGMIDAAATCMNDLTVETLVRQARSHADAGADVVAPSDMMDGRIGAIRDAFETAGLVHTRILAYAAKYASSFYGPFREAVGSAATARRRQQAHLSDGPGQFRRGAARGGARHRGRRRHGDDQAGAAVSGHRAARQGPSSACPPSSTRSAASTR